jgi:acyl carrier protein
MATDDLEAALVDLARTELSLEGTLAPDADLAAHLDSMQRLRLLVAIEDRYRVSFDAEDEAELRTLAEAVRALRRKLEARP